MINYSMTRTTGQARGVYGGGAGVCGPAAGFCRIKEQQIVQPNCVMRGERESGATTVSSRSGGGVGGLLVYLLFCRRKKNKRVDHFLPFF